MPPGAPPNSTPSSGLGRTREVVFDTLLEKLKKEEILAVPSARTRPRRPPRCAALAGVQIAVLGIYAALIGFILQSPALAQAFGLSGVHFGFQPWSCSVSPLRTTGFDCSACPSTPSAAAPEYAADAFAASGWRSGRTHPQRAPAPWRQENLANLNPRPLVRPAALPVILPSPARLRATPSRAGNVYKSLIRRSSSDNVEQVCFLYFNRKLGTCHVQLHPRH